MPTPVLLLHGLGRTGLSMAPMAWALRRAGFAPSIVDYPSRRRSIADLVLDAVGPRVDALEDDGPVHFVTHSLGGVLARAYASERFDAGRPLPDGSRAVMLGPPHAGSPLADWFGQHQPFKAILGPALQELGTGDSSVPASLGPIRGLEVGVIAGDYAQPPFGRVLEGANDGFVSVESAFAPDGLADQLQVRSGHTFPMATPEIIRQTIHFLEVGRFDHDTQA